MVFSWKHRALYVSYWTTQNVWLPFGIPLHTVTQFKQQPGKSCTVWGASAAYCFHPSQDLDLDRIKQFNLTGVAGKAELSSICYKVSSPPVLGWWSDLHILPMSVGEGKIPIRALQEYKPDCLRKVHIRACNYKHILNFILAPSSLRLKELFLGS